MSEVLGIEPFTRNIASMGSRPDYSAAFGGTPGWFGRTRGGARWYDFPSARLATIEETTAPWEADVLAHLKNQELTAQVQVL